MDAWVVEYNTNRPHQALNEHLPVTPAERFTAVAAGDRALVELWLPPATTLAPVPTQPTSDSDPATAPAEVASAAAGWLGGAIEFDKVVPPSGMITVAGKAFWLGTYRSGLTVRVGPMSK